MSITKEAVTAAEQLMTDIQSRIFFNKLASLGVTPETDEQAATLWETGDKILCDYPRLSDSGRTTKQASADTFGDLCSTVTSDGCSLDAHRIADELCRNPDVVKATHILLAVNNV